ncbi:MAG: carbohydrate-binding protein, partial [Clostridiaceae bacterium]|nr:carbohydrate-binding protein [Clostridiaceae bacterium]
MNLKKRILAILTALAIIIRITFTFVPVAAATGDPGKIEAETYSAMSGIQVESCSEGGLNVGYIDAGDWMEYTLNVQTAGLYTTEFRVSSPYTGTQLQLLKGTTALATMTIPSTGGWQNWQTVTTSLNLSAGSQTLRVKALTNGWNFNWMNLTSQNTQPEKVAIPTFNPVAGTYTSAQNVTIACATAGAIIKYTTDGSTPTSTSLTYTGAIKVASTTTIKALATMAGMTDSAIATSLYTINIPGGKAIPGNIEAESYNAMLNVATEVCSEGGQNVGWIDTGDY